jgi:hypothetical protein
VRYRRLSAGPPIALRGSAHGNHFCVTPGHRSGDATRGPIGNSSQRIVSEMC